VSHHDRLLAELRGDPELAAEYLNAAAHDGDPRVYLAALRTIAVENGIAKVAKAAGAQRESQYRAWNIAPA
jgi:probable addiction module antidote protein